MPYIKKINRDELNMGKTPENVGELNYVLTKLILDYLGDNPHYQNYNDVLGVLTAIQFEIYRRRIADYEIQKCAENGDVY